MKRIAPLVLVLLLSACAAQHTDILIPDRPLLANGNALLLASLGYSTGDDPKLASQLTQGNMILGALGPTMHVKLRSNSSGKAVEHWISTGDNMYENGAWANDQAVRQSAHGRRVLIGDSVQAGEYEVIEMYAEMSIGLLSWHVRPELSPPARITIAPGEIAYLGTFEFQVGMGSNLVGQSVPAEGRIVVLNELNDDLSLLYKLRPDLKSTPIRNLVE
jgi:hypothetical protein